jgi:membrane fusion protein (multidrug efflux system)
MILKRVCAIALSGLLAAAPAVMAQAPKAKPSGLPVKAAPVRIGTVTDDVTAVGTLLANESVMIRPEVAGRVAAIHFKEGQAVAVGARLVALDAEELRAQLDASRADERLTGQRAERAAELSRRTSSASRRSRTRARPTRRRARSAGKTRRGFRRPRSSRRLPESSGCAR